MNIQTPVSTIYGNVSSQFGEAWRNQIETLKHKFSDAIEEIFLPSDSLTDIPIIYVKKVHIVSILSYLKSEPGFEYSFLTDLTAIDETPREQRFDVVYHLFSTTRFWRLRLKVKVAENEEVPTAISVWESANWAEREVWDMFGVKFSGHPDLRRILMDQRWEGHPLRKDYPIKGYQVFATPEPINPDLLK